LPAPDKTAGKQPNYGCLPVLMLSLIEALVAKGDIERA